MELPSTEVINDKRIVQFKQSITDTIGAGDLGQYHRLIEQYQQEHNVPAIEIAAALAKLVQGDEPLLLQNKPTPKIDKDWDKDRSSGRDSHRKANGSQQDGRGEHSRSQARHPGSGDERRPPRKDDGYPDKGMERFRIEVGHAHRVMPGNIVGAIANEAGLDSKDIGRINIYDDYSTIDLPAGMPEEVFRDLKKIWVVGKTLNISRIGETPDTGKRHSGKPARGGKPQHKVRAKVADWNSDKAPPNSKSRTKFGEADLKPKKQRTKDKKNIGKRRVPKSPKP